MSKILKKQTLFVILVVIITVCVNLIIFSTTLGTQKKVPEGANEEEISESIHSSPTQTGITQATFRVTYFGADNQVLQALDVMEGDYAVPPANPTIDRDAIFLGWDKSFTYTFDDMDIYPIIEDVSKTTNAISIDTHYIAHGEQFNAVVKLGGDVNCSKIEFDLTFDSELLTFIGCDGMRPDIYIEEGESILSISFDPVEKQSVGIELVELQFQTAQTPFMFTQLRLSPTLVLKLDSDGDEVGGDCTLYNGKLYIY